MFKNKKWLVAVSAVTILGSILYFGKPTQANNEDPLISLSYFNEQIAKLKQELGQSGKTETADLEVVEIAKGQTLIANQGSELILRAGEMTAVTSRLGGLSDITLGRDIEQGEAVGKNHLLIVPRSDERGLFATTDAIVLVRGSYYIK